MLPDRQEKVYQLLLELTCKANQPQERPPEAVSTVLRRRRTRLPGRYDLRCRLVIFRADRHWQCIPHRQAFMQIPE